MLKKRVIIYIDGFNFYYGLKTSNWKKFYWLDIVKFFSTFLGPHQELVQVNYFSAIPDNPGQQKRQDLFFSANKLNSKFQLHLGKFLRKKVTCRGCYATHFTYEEKESDVRVATILVSADSDLIPPIEFIKDYKPNHKIFIYFPPNRESFSLKKLGHSYIKLERHPEKFKSCLLADEIEDPKTHYIIKRPTNWR